MSPTKVTKGKSLPKLRTEGGQDVKPSGWARRLKHQLYGPISESTTRLKTMKSLREPVVRDMTAAEFESQLRHRRKLDAALVQVVGTPSYSPCDNCEADCSPFTSCMVAQDELGGACANCYWNGKSRTCLFSSCSVKFIMDIMKGALQPEEKPLEGDIETNQFKKSFLEDVINKAQKSFDTITALSQLRVSLEEITRSALQLKAGIKEAQEFLEKMKIETVEDEDEEHGEHEEHEKDEEDEEDEKNGTNGTKGKHEA
ncbi:hypothetical protein NUU61_007900 [Penicillium alfredii]|uniref:Uncharacterized protein n=1 Tax=Penicillium alfredii TaxID=1506179 RepID=A0A9W9JYS1_9EURO|nr:uncharacterized protein NUU61_007900 [Penicillium alfredii]KAJ5086593.1 hypothetical protein NUU61_007900 [Penicillium alfredii]